MVQDKEDQRAALVGVLDEIGYAAAILVRETPEGDRIPAFDADPILAGGGQDSLKFVYGDGMAYVAVTAHDSLGP